MVNGALDWCFIKGRLERKSDPRKDSDVEQDLQVRRSSGGVGAGGVLRCSRLDGRASDPESIADGRGTAQALPDIMLGR